ncbi:acidic repeat-containing protein [Chelonus insularis]|uniref:acidic repeat-containing protein n=1 Tax=Chelonus insularis TaxID=460826 RepID=UPI00158EABDB|nr:acidic repeat-containing protein [Chelonus insularis]
MTDIVYNISSSDEDSQNFRLQVTNSIVVDETLDEDHLNKKNNQNDIIIINDSSDDNDDRLENLNTVSKPSIPHNRNCTASISSFDASEIFTEDETRNSWNSNRISELDLIKNKNQKKLVIPSTKKPTKKITTSKEKTISNKENINTCNIFEKKCTINEVIKQPKQISKINGDNKCENENKLHLTPNSAKFDVRTTPLTKKDTRNILKTVKSLRTINNSPGLWSRNHQRINKNSSSNNSESDNSLVDNSDDDSQYNKTPSGKKIIHPAWIDETDSEVEYTENQHHTEPLIQKQVPDARIELNNIPTDSFELKKKEISRWLISNNFDARRSDSSVSQVPPSERSSINSGNSSLERLEENYETPNNRDKFHSKIIFHDSRSNKTTPGIESLRIQTIKDDCDSTSPKIKSSDSKKKLLLLKKSTSNSSNSSSSLSKHRTYDSSSLRTPEQNIDNCVDILNKIYGNTWKDHADVILPKTSTATTIKKDIKNKHLLIKNNRAIQSDRKINYISKKNSKTGSVNSSTDKKLNTPTENSKIKTKSTKVISSTKKITKTNQYDSSFINDSNSDSSDGNTTYLTALTNPVLPRYRIMTKKKVETDPKKKVFDICDSDTESSDYDNERNNENYQRRLDFSDNEHNSSNCTSEYDPGDFVPPKTLSVIKSRVQNSRASFLKSLSASIPLNNVHPDAIKYRKNFKQTKDELCKYLFKYYNEKVFDNKLPSDMLIEWSSRMRGTAGFCFNKTRRKANGEIERSSRIQLATKVLDSPERLRDTLIHEMCHAATWIINHISNGHGVFWRTWASKAMKTFPELPPIKRCHDYKIATKYTYRCTTCGYCIGRHSKSLDTVRKRCGHCYGKFELLINRTTRSGRIEHETPKVKAPSKFALYVKENYHEVKTKHLVNDHREIMKILGQQFSAMKIAQQITLE